jgi:hypothetical protein
MQIGGTNARGYTSNVRGWGFAPAQEKPPVSVGQAMTEAMEAMNEAMLDLQRQVQSGSSEYRPIRPNLFRAQMTGPPTKQISVW